MIAKIIYIQYTVQKGGRKRNCSPEKKDFENTKYIYLKTVHDDSIVIHNMV